jgi:K+-sensing histidine kinase KdpD
VAIFLSAGAGKEELVTAFEPSGTGLNAAARASATRVFQFAAADRNARRQGAFLPLTTAERAIGVIVILPQYSRLEIDSGDDFLLATVASHVALAIKRARLEHEVREMEVLRKADELQRNLLNSVSHSLRTPLAAILSAVNPITQAEATDAASVRELACIAETEAFHLDTLIGNLLDLSRLEARALKTKLEPHDTEDLIGAVLHQFLNFRLPTITVSPGWRPDGSALSTRHHQRRVWHPLVLLLKSSLPVLPPPPHLAWLCNRAF